MFFVALWTTVLVGTAVHELGHYVVLRRLRIPPQDLRIRMNLATAGRVELREAEEWLRPNDPRYGPAVWARAPSVGGQMVMLAAGLGTELVLFLVAGLVAGRCGWSEGLWLAASASVIAWGGVLRGDAPVMWRIDRARALAWGLAGLAITGALVAYALMSVRG